MKNKRVQNDKKGQQKVLNVAKTPMNTKNRDHLRKKLKGLLEKQLLSSDKPADKNIHPKLNSLKTPDKSCNTSTYNKPLDTKPKSSQEKLAPKQNGKEAKHDGKPLKQTKNSPHLNKGNENDNVRPLKSKTSKKKKKVVISDEVNSKDNVASLKRKLDEKVQLSRKAAKIIKNSQSSDASVSKTKKQKQINGDQVDAVSKTKKRKHFNGEQVAIKQVKSPKKKKENGDGNPTKSKKAKLPKRKSKTDLSQKSPKSKQYAQGRGPLRPPTSESEFDYDLDSSPRKVKLKTELKASPGSKCDKKLDSSPALKAANTEQALIRAKNDFEGSCSGSDDNTNYDSYQSNLDFLYDGSYDYLDETETFSSEQSEEEYTGEESCYEYTDEESSYEYTDEESPRDYSSEDYEECSEEDHWDDHSSDNEDYFHCSTDDESYHPPGNMSEDIYIAKGTAVKYELNYNDVGFDSDSSCAQIIEIPTKATEPVNKNSQIPPPVIKPIQTNKCSSKNVEQTELESDDSCPELVPIESTGNTSDFDYSSSDSSHGSSSSCGCGSCDETFVNTSSEQRYTPMTPEVIKAKAEVNDEIDSLFKTRANVHQTNATPNALLEEINNPNASSLRSKVYTVNNEVLNNDLLARSESSKTHERQPNLAERSQNIKVNVIFRQKVAETSQKMTEESSPVNKKANTTPLMPSQEKLLSQNSFGSTEKSSPVNKKANTTPLTPSQEKQEKLLPQKLFGSTGESSPMNNKKKISTRTLFFNAINCNQVLVLLKDPLYLYGTVKLKLLAGSLEIFGYNPKRNEILEIFSPRGYSSLKIESSHSNEEVFLNEKEILSFTPFFIRSDLEEILAKFEPSKDSIVILERNDRSKKVNMLRKYMVEHLFPNMNSIQSDRPFYTSEFLLRCIITTHSENAIFINPDWRTIRVQNNSKIMAVGGKSVGKSTLVRYLINKNLNKYPKILLVDLDIGQPEIFVPQTVSVTTLTTPLLGPGYFLNKQPDKSFLVGHVSVIHSLEPYIKSLTDLFEFCNTNREYSDIPWIVNTMGYNKGFGDEIISVICSLLEPTNIIQFESGREINDFDAIMIKDNVKSIERNIVGDMFKSSREFEPQHQLTLIKSVIPKSRSAKNEGPLKSRDMRLAMILSRLSTILIGHAEWMADVKPLCASIDDLNIVNMGDDQIDKEDLVKTLIGNLVYLCRMESGKAHECFGIGIVRGVDYPLRQIYLLPAMPYDFLSNVNCLAICGIPLPSSILLNQGPKVKGAATYVYNTVDEASSMYIKQMHNKPQQFLTGRRKSVIE